MRTALTTTVQSVQTAMLVGVNVVLLAIDLESGVLDSVGITSGHPAQVRVLLIDAVVAGIVEAKDNIALYAVNVFDEQVADGSSVGDEVGADALARDLVLAILVRASAVAGGLRLGESEERQGRKSGQAGEHVCDLETGVVCLGEVVVDRVVCADRLAQAQEFMRSAL